jgi:hypothetical protein
MKCLLGVPIEGQNLSVKQAKVGASKVVSTEAELWDWIDNSLGDLEDLKVLGRLASLVLPKGSALQLSENLIELPENASMEVRRRTAAASLISQLVDTLVLLAAQ